MRMLLHCFGVAVYVFFRKVNRLRTLVIMATSLGVLVVTQPIAAGDVYFDDAIDQIAETSFVSPDAYGFSGVDTIWTSAGSIADREGYVFCTKEGRIHSKIERFAPPEFGGTPSLSVLTVRGNHGGSDVTKAAATVSGRKHNLTVNIDRRSYKVGLDEVYLASSGGSAVSTKASRQPWQMLVNPCFALLGCSVDDVRRSNTIALPDEGKLKAYECKTSDGKTLRLYFSPEYDNKLTKSDCQVNEAIREVRTVEKWGHASDGMIVPLRFKKEQFVKGKLAKTYVRELTNVLIGGDVPDSLFDADHLPEFRQQWDSIYDERREMFVQTGIHAIADVSGIESIQVAVTSHPSSQQSSTTALPAKDANDRANANLQANGSTSDASHSHLLGWCIGTAAVAVACGGLWARKRRSKSGSEQA
jgi:hypothetical protein